MVLTCRDYAAILTSAVSALKNRFLLCLCLKKFLDAHFRGSIAVNGSRRDFNLDVDVSFVDPFAKSYENLSPDEVLVSKEDLKKLKYQNFATGSGHI